MADEHESDRLPPEIEWKGPLDDGKENKSVWRGKISAKIDTLKQRFGRDEEGTRSYLAELKERVGSFYVVAGIQGVVRCIDGRGEEGVIPDNRNLGTQVPGGTPVTSMGWRFAVGLSSENTLVKDFAEYRALVESLGLPYISGAHQDEHNASHPENTGCGAIDKMLEIIDIMSEKDEYGNYRVYDYAKAIAGAYMDDATFDEAFKSVQDNLEHLRQLKEIYFNQGNFRSDIVEEVKEGGERLGRKTVETLSGEHNEIFLIVNRVEGETFDRDGFAASTGGLAQAFNYDAWAVPQRARDIFIDEAEKQNIMMVTNFMYAVGTAMALTDGSLELGIRD